MPEINGTSALATTGEILTPEQEAARALQSAMEVLTMAKAVHVTTADEYRAADEACAAIKAALKRADAKRDELVRPLNTVVKKINAQFKDVENAYNSALAAYRGPMTTFQARLAEERRKAEEAARKERERIESEAREASRKAEEAAAEARRQAQEAEKAAQATDDPFEAALRQQEAADAQRAAAEQLEVAKQGIRDARAVEVAPAFVQKVTGSGVKTFTVWDFEVTNPDLVPMQYRPINYELIAKDVRELKGACAIPGVEVSSHVEVK
jgi:chromosome segregation ATPase